MVDLTKISTEGNNKNTWDIDKVSTLEAVKLINNEDLSVAKAVETQLKEIAVVVDEGYKAIMSGGRVIYMGAGTSGRLGILDASEIFPTFGEAKLFTGLIAGGEKAIQFPVENAEDDKESATVDLKDIKITTKDFVIGISASGRTPYVTSALVFAKELGCKTASISTTKNAEISVLAEYPIEVVTGPEPIMGSTRMKSGTAQKMVLNTISTLIMVKYGKVFNNLMVDIQPTNEKLKKRAVLIVKTITGADEKNILEILQSTDFNVKITLVAILKKMSVKDAAKLLSDGNIADIKKVL